MTRWVLVLALLAPLLTACESLQRKDQASRLQTSLKTYAASVRWDNLDTALGFLRPREGSAQPPRGLDGLKVTGYAIRVNNVNEDSNEAEVTITFTYYFQDQGRLASVDQTEVWYYDDPSSAWVMDATALPRFR